jgi:hypothetical protein
MIKAAFPSPFSYYNDNSVLSWSSAMKPHTLLLTCWGLSVGASPLEKRQSSLAAIINSLPPSYVISPLKTEIVKPQLRATATRKKIRYGPIKLPANKIGASKPEVGGGHSHGGATSEMDGKSGIGGAPKGLPFNPLDVLTGQRAMDPNGFSQMRVLSDGAMCTNCTVLAGKMDVIFENGTRADISGGVYLHHVITIDLSKQNKRWVSGCAGGSAAPKAVGGAAGGGLNTFIGGAVVGFFFQRRRYQVELTSVIGFLRAILHHPRWQI